MDTYLLLRSNKQSGPYSLQQLVNVGLKPYDLVWVEGKSAAWRYPSEVDPLKAYAPKVEEQPYDRFYKRPEEKIPEQPVQEVKTVQQKEEITQQKEEVYVAPVEQATVVASSKKVFVAMPGNHVAKKIQPVNPKPQIIAEEKPKIIEEKKIEPKPVIMPHETREPVVKEQPVLPRQEPTFTPPTYSSKDDATLDEKYSESLDEIKRRYTETYLNRKKRSRWTSTHTSIAQVFGGALFFCVLVVFAYKNFAGEETSPRTTVIQPDKRAINTSTVATTPVTVPLAVAETEKQSQPRKTQTTKKTVDPPVENSSTGDLGRNDEVQTKETQIAAIDYQEKKAVMPAADEEKPEVVKPKAKPVNIRKLVNVRANNYKQRAFGGVMNLELTVNNDSKFALDRVTVELQYLKPSEQPIKTETIVFNSISANDSKTLKIPDYLRGVKISYRVTGVESSQYERQTAGL